MVYLLTKQTIPEYIVVKNGEYNYVDVIEHMEPEDYVYHRGLGKGYLGGTEQGLLIYAKTDIDDIIENRVNASVYFLFERENGQLILTAVDTNMGTPSSKYLSNVFNGTYSKVSNGTLVFPE